LSDRILKVYAHIIKIVKSKDNTDLIEKNYFKSRKMSFNKKFNK